MSTAWTTKEAGLEPPKAILSFYGPTDLESGGESLARALEFRMGVYSKQLTLAELDVRRAEMYPERHRAGIFTRIFGPQISTNYNRI